MNSVPENEHMNSTHNAATAQILNSYNNVYNMNGNATLAPNANAVPTNTTSAPEAANEFEETNLMSSTFGMHLNDETLNPFNDVPFDNPFDDIPPNGLSQSRSPKGSASGQSGYNNSAQSRSPKGSASVFDQAQRRSPNGSASGQQNSFVQVNPPAQQRPGHVNILGGGNTQQPNNYFNMNGSNGTSGANTTINGTSPRAGVTQQPSYSTSPPKTSGFVQNTPAPPQPQQPQPQPQQPQHQQPQLSASPPKAQGWGNRPQLNINTNQPALNGYSTGPLSPTRQPEAGQAKSPRPMLQSHVSQPKLGNSTVQSSSSLAPPTSPRRGISTNTLTNNTEQQPSSVFESSAPLARPALGSAGPKRAALPIKRLDISSATADQTSGGSTSPTQTSPRGVPLPIGRDGTQYNPTPRPPPNATSTTYGASPKTHTKANTTPIAPPRSASPSVSGRSGEVADLAVVVSALLSTSAPAAVKTQYAVKLANYLATDGDYVRSYLKEKVGIDNAIKLIESLASILKAKN